MWRQCTCHRSRRIHIYLGCIKQFNSGMQSIVIIPTRFSIPCISWQFSHANPIGTHCSTGRARARASAAVWAPTRTVSTAWRAASSIDTHSRRATCACLRPPITIIARLTRTRLTILLCCSICAQRVGGAHVANIFCDQGAWGHALFASRRTRHAHNC